ncbi:DUF4160 domain-containing protein [Dyadobacter sp. CY343]|jgi:hypothetical protein|uniref:DUF4160 domain-containing protein n=1 Tax=Dyadobacter sp. CY343 TaxID=2907299 RepID=UPI001F2D3C44|nr:DUF4160 domain-containing protein [Dyadobacter sp. CY343]MCE7062858.1 DUF4160 domain-containing protein [Dyadobacter sp. CY343]
MPEISRFFGIVIFMYFKDHLPPHFHAEYAGDEAQFSIETGNILAGRLPGKQIRLVQAWVELHREELYLNYFESQKDNAQFRKIRPLQ